MQYEFETNELGISRNGIHLLRNRFNYQTYDYREIEKIEIEKGHLINNWLLVCIFGLSLAVGALYYGYHVYLAVIEVRVPRISVQAIVAPVIPLLLGLYCVRAALQTGETIRITHNGKTRAWPLTKLCKAHQLEDLRHFLKVQPALNGKIHS